MFGINKKNKKAKKILIVEDDAMLARVLTKSVKAEKMDALNITNGLDALEAAKTYKPNVILLDLILPGLDGFEVLKQLKADSETKGIPVFVISNLDDLSDVKSAKALGAEEYFIKANIELKKIINATKERAEK